MSQVFGPTGPVPAAPSLAWSQVWIRALTPSVETFEGLVRDPNASTNRAYAWVFVSALIGSAISALAQLALTGMSIPGSSADSATSALFSSPWLLLICGAPVAAVLAVLGLMISAGITQLIARALEGTGTYSSLVYAMAAYSAPLAIISGVISSIPYINCLVFPLGVYSLVLNVVAVKAVHQFGWGRAIASSVLIFAGILVLTVLVAVVVIVVLALLGPAIGNVFSNIVQELGTPAP